MQQLFSVALALIGGVLVLLGGYHVLVVGPHLRRLGTAVTSHDELLGGGSAKATDRISTIERELAALGLARTLDGSRLDELERIARVEVPRIGFIRYNAFDDTGSDLSYTLALLNRDGDGVVVSSVWSREETRTYGKAIAKFAATVDLSKEERDAIGRARAS